VIDSHCHLADPAFAADLDAVISRARAAGVEQALVILEAGDLHQASQARQIAMAWPTTGFAIGVHPHHAHMFADSPRRAADLVREQVMTTPAAWAVGEIGLDYHYDLSPRDVQQAVFREQLRLALDLRRPVVIHTREADQDTLAILDEEGRGRLSGVFHARWPRPRLLPIGGRDRHVSKGHRPSCHAGHRPRGSPVDGNG